MLSKKYKRGEEPVARWRVCDDSSGKAVFACWHRLCAWEPQTKWLLRLLRFQPFFFALCSKSSRAGRGLQLLFERRSVLNPAAVPKEPPRSCIQRSRISDKA